MHDEIYLGLVRKVLEQGKKREDRTGTGTISLFGEQVRYDLREGFPLLTTKKVYFKAIKGELLWFLSGSTSAKELREKYGTTIWDEWDVDGSGKLGPIYGQQWRAWKALDTNNVPYVGDPEQYSIDQITSVIKQIKENPNDRGIIVSAWNVADLPDMRLRPCHCLYQFYVDGDELDLQLYQRSADLFLGVPFNVASYSLLLAMVAQATGKRPRYFVHTFGDLHIYTNHLDAVAEQLSRHPKHSPTLYLNPDRKALDDFTMDDIKVLDYDPHPSISAPVSV